MMKLPYRLYGFKAVIIIFYNYEYNMVSKSDGGTKYDKQRNEP